MDIKNFLNSGIIEKYILGLAEPSEMDQVDRMAKEYPEVNAHICKMQNCMEEYAEMNTIRPPRHVNKAIMAQLSAEGNEMAEPFYPEQEPAHGLSGIWKLGAGLAAMMIIALGGISWTLYNNQKDAQDQLAVLSTQIKHLQSDRKALQTSNEKIVQEYSVLKDVATLHVHLKGSEMAPQALAVVYWNTTHNKGYLNIVNLPKCPNGNEYQMWADVNGKHMDMGILKVDDQGKVLHKIPYVKGSSGFVITLEAAGGSSEPTTSKVFAHGSI